jgi:hypothetical protein
MGVLGVAPAAGKEERKRGGGLAGFTIVRQDLWFSKGGDEEEGGEDEGHFKSHALPPLIYLETFWDARSVNNCGTMCRPMAGQLTNTRQHEGTISRQSVDMKN